METLVEAVLAGDTGSVTALLGEGLSPDSRDEGSTPLYTAAVQGEQALARLLLDAGADPNLRSGDETEGTPLCAAACHGQVEIVRALLAHGADPNLREDESWTPLRWAASHGHEHVARELRRRQRPRAHPLGEAQQRDRGHTDGARAPRGPAGLEHLDRRPAGR